MKSNTGKDQVKKDKEKKIPKSFRLAPLTVEHLIELSKMLKEDEVEVVDRAIERLYVDRYAVLEEDIALRRAKPSPQ